VLPVAPPALGDRRVTLAPDSKGFDTSTFSKNRNYLPSPSWGLSRYTAHHSPPSDGQRRWPSVFAR
jgi:hypothetical protein